MPTGIQRKWENDRSLSYSILYIIILPQQATSGSFLLYDVAYIYTKPEEIWIWNTARFFLETHKYCQERDGFRYAQVTSLEIWICTKVSVGWSKRLWGRKATKSGLSIGWKIWLTIFRFYCDLSVSIGVHQDPESNFNQTPKPFALLWSRP